MAGIFGGFFLVSVSHETKREKSSKNSGEIRSKIRGKIRDENSKNSGKLSFCDFPDIKAFSSKRGLFFHGKGASRAPKFHTDPPPQPLPTRGWVAENHSTGSPKEAGGGGGAGGGGVSVWNVGSARGPFTLKKRPLFDQNSSGASFLFSSPAS